MKIQSKAYGLVDIDEKQVYHFEMGIPAFDRLKTWALFEAKQVPFSIFQSLEDVDVAFFVMNPWVCRQDYEVKLEDSDLQQLGVDQTQTSSLSILAILAIPPGRSQEMSINLQAPLVFNPENQRGAQVVLGDVQYQVHHLVAQELERAGKGGAMC
jgi:flagellar assembly factor FliW